MIRKIYFVKRCRDLIQVDGPDGEIGSLPANAVVEIYSDEGPVFIKISDLDDADIVSYVRSL